MGEKNGSDDATVGDVGVNDRFIWREGDVTINPIDPEKDWITAYRHGNATTLVRNAPEFCFFVEQTRGDQSVAAFIAAFMETAQGRIMPSELRAELTDLGLL